MAKIDSTEEIEKLRIIEKANPKYEGGRVGVFAEMDDREAELRPAPGPKEVQEHDPEEAQESKCPHCDFVAASEAGLEAHLEASHDL